MDTLTITLILGTARENRNSEYVFDWLTHKLQAEDGIELQTVDVRDYLFGQTYEAWNEHPDVPKIAEWKKAADSSDAFIIVIPEYNHGYPGELKILLDAAFEEYFDKPVALAGVSTGGFGGARVIDLIKPTLIEMGMMPLGNALYFREVEDVFADDGSMNEDKTDRYEKQYSRALDGLKKYAKHLKDLQE